MSQERPLSRHLTREVSRLRQAAVRVQREHADRYVDLFICVEIADQHVAQEFDSETVVLRRADWNRIVAVGRGHMSQKARQAIERFQERSFRAAMKAKP